MSIESCRELLTVQFHFVGSVYRLRGGITMGLPFPTWVPACRYFHIQDRKQNFEPCYQRQVLYKRHMDDIFCLISLKFYCRNLRIISETILHPRSGTEQLPPVSWCPHPAQNRRVAGPQYLPQTATDRAAHSLKQLCPYATKTKPGTLFNKQGASNMFWRQIFKCS